ncbi:hypothetical protein KCP75_02465 [Salmonella enterica subsp. enterica]|nr:hypothetical protein KCP75_02465 [Salmonella enterica subsp. enterica]
MKFGTSGHRGSAGRHQFRQTHILAIARAIAEKNGRKMAATGCYGRKDTHAALGTGLHFPVLEVLASRSGVDVIDTWENNGFTPTPVCQMLSRSRQQKAARWLMVVSHLRRPHNPPEDGGIKYNPPNGGPADANVTKSGRDVGANALLARWPARR